MRVLDLFSGIGGFSLGLERAGMHTIQFVEIDPYCRAVLKKHWPNVPCHDDIRTFHAPAGFADVICGGFPCQDISNAGKRAGIDGERSGLWKEALRVIYDVRPDYALLENVSALRNRGLGTILGDLAQIGYDAEWNCIPAAAMGALHYRDRIWILAYPHSDSMRSQGFRPAPTGAWSEQQFARLVQDQIQLSVPAGRLRSLSDGVPGRMGQLKGYGNAVVPQIPEIIGRAIMECIKP